MTSKLKTPDPLGDTIRTGAREASAAWGWIVAMGALWVGYGMFVLSFRVGSLVAVATLVGVAFLLGGITQLVVASREPTMRWLNIAGGILGVAAGILTFVWPGITLYVVSIMVAWYLIVFGTIHIVSALAGPKLLVVVDRAAVRHRRAGARSVGRALLGVLAGHAGDPGRGVVHQPRGGGDLRRLQPAPGRQAGRPAGRLASGRAAASATALPEAVRRRPLCTREAKEQK